MFYKIKFKIFLMFILFSYVKKAEIKPQKEKSKQHEAECEVWDQNNGSTLSLLIKMECKGVYSNMLDPTSVPYIISEIWKLNAQKALRNLRISVSH